MTPDLYERVALRRDLDEYNLKAGDMAVLIDRVPHPSGGEGGVVLEMLRDVKRCGLFQWVQVPPG